MNIRRKIPQLRAAAFVMVGITSGAFVGAGIWALAVGRATPEIFKVVSSWIALTGITAAAAALILDRRRGRREVGREKHPGG